MQYSYLLQQLQNADGGSGVDAVSFMTRYFPVHNALN